MSALPLILRSEYRDSIDHGRDNFDVSNCGGIDRPRVIGQRHEVSALPDFKRSGNVFFEAREGVRRCIGGECFLD